MSETVDYEIEFNNRARVPEHPGIIASWVRDAEAYRRENDGRWRTLRYGPNEREAMDFFPATGEAGGDRSLVFFIHGGYWQALDRSYFSHLARGLNARGVDVVLPSYDLCPQVTVAGIVDQMRSAVRELVGLGRRLVVSGHSAGGHLAACLYATDWKAIDPGLPADFITSAFSISGLFDLAPLIGTSLNTALKLDGSSAREVSPQFWAPPRGGVFDAVVGGEESPEFRRQSRVMADVWGNAGIKTQYLPIVGENHFTVIAPLADPQSKMTARLAELAV